MPDFCGLHIKNIGFEFESLATCSLYDVGEVTLTYSSITSSEKWRKKYSTYLKSCKNYVNTVIQIY